MSHEYNTAPEGLKVIPVREWTHGMFQYCLKQSESRQVRDRDNDMYFDLRMFDVPNFDNKKLGYAIMNDWREDETRFCRYGLDEDWISFERRFAAQFVNDNS